MKLKVIVPINNSALNAGIQQSVEQVIAPDVTISVENIKQGTSFIECRSDLATNAPHVMALAKRTEKEGYDGIFVSDMDMCGVEQSRELINIPIIGGFRASAYTAMMLGQSLSIITVLQSVTDLQIDHFRDFGILTNFSSIKNVDMSVGELSDTEKAIAHVFTKSLEAIKENGADGIILGCTGFVGVAKPVMKLLQDEGYDIPVLDPNQTAISYLELLVRTGQKQSRQTYVYQETT